MLGSFRFLLAALVALSHDGFRILGLNPGVSAVVGFYCLSGYVMAGLLYRHYDHAAAVPRFYADRALRIFPAYLAFAGLTLLWHLITGETTRYIQSTPDAPALLDNLLVIPLNLYMFNGSDAHTLIPPAWSLGAELQFYLLAPLLLLTPLRGPALVVSLGFQAVAAVGWLHTDWWGYRLLPGVLFIFLLGALLYRGHKRLGRIPAWVVVAGSFGAAILWALALQGGGVLSRPHNREVLLGLVVAVAAVQLLARRGRRPWDEWLGHLSYNVFLGHFLVLWSGLPLAEAGLARALSYLGWVSALAALVHYGVERPALAWRRRLRRVASG
ncbi:acyltransferase family protein [Arhodomonas sp. SL1]|uniref:acyltransferase family protein n=1 Tax=Arhodomonas sp. SL1 TaxID=3425691 RepID=UPI003F88517D